MSLGYLVSLCHLIFLLNFRIPSGMNWIQESFMSLMAYPFLCECVERMKQMNGT